MKEKIICAGFGGQGIMFLGKLVAYTMMHEDKHVTYIPSYGPEMRGGTANCNVIVSDDEIDSPMVDEADTVIVMNQPSYEKFKSAVKPGGLLIVNTSLINITDPPEGVKIIEIAATDLANEMGQRATGKHDRDGPVQRSAQTRRSRQSLRRPAQVPRRLQRTLHPRSTRKPSKKAKRYMENPRKRGISKPRWLKRQLSQGPRCAAVEKLLDGLRLQTVCTNAKCPNLGECFGAGTATFMILGSVCTRGCRFCAVAGGKPEPVEPDEPERVAQAAKKLNLKHVVVTSVTRDDLPDGRREALRADSAMHTRNLRRDGARYSRRTSSATKTASQRSPVRTTRRRSTTTTSRRSSASTPRRGLRRTTGARWNCCRCVKRLNPDIVTKSGLMVVLGEKKEEIFGVLRDLRNVGCDALTIGQYLQPSPAHLPVERFVEPEEFDEYRAAAEEMGFVLVASGPFVRSSYHAGELLGKLKK